MPQVINLKDPADWFMLSEINRCKSYYRSLPFADQERFKITERKEQMMFKDIVITNSYEVYA